MTLERRQWFSLLSFQQPFFCSHSPVEACPLLSVIVLIVDYYYDKIELHRTYLGSELVAYTCVLKHSEGRGGIFLYIHNCRPSWAISLIPFWPKAMKKYSQKFENLKGSCYILVQSFFYQWHLLILSFKI